MTQALNRQFGGGVYQVGEADITVNPFEIPAHWPRVFAMCAGWDVTAALWAALDPTSGTIFLYAEHCHPHSEISENARAIRAKGAWIPGIINPAAPGRTERDGWKLIERYREQGLKIERALDTPEAGIAEAWRRFVAQELKVFTNLTTFLMQYRLYRRDERGQIVRRSAQLLTCLHSLLISGLSKMRTQPTKQSDTIESFSSCRPTSGPQSWMGS